MLIFSIKSRWIQGEIQLSEEQFGIFIPLKALKHCPLSQRFYFLEGTLKEIIE